MLKIFLKSSWNFFFFFFNKSEYFTLIWDVLQIIGRNGRVSFFPMHTWSLRIWTMSFRELEDARGDVDHSPGKKDDTEDCQLNLKTLVASSVLPVRENTTLQVVQKPWDFWELIQETKHITFTFVSFLWTTGKDPSFLSSCSINAILNEKMTEETSEYQKMWEWALERTHVLLFQVKKTRVALYP